MNQIKIAGRNCIFASLGILIKSVEIINPIWELKFTKILA